MENFIGKKATIAGAPAPTGSFVVNAGKVTEAKSSFKEHLGKAFSVESASLKDGVYTIELGYVRKVRLFENENTSQPNSQTSAAIALALGSSRKHLADAPPQLQGKRVMIDGSPAPDGNYIIQNGVVVSSTEIEPNYQLQAEWDRSFAAGEHMAMRRDNPNRYKQLFFAKFGRIPNI